MFTAVLGHDLRNPLSAILMAAHMIQHQAENETVRGTAKRILMSGKRMTRMIDDMLDLARARLAGGIPLKISHSDLAEPVQRVVREYETAFPQRRVELQQDGDLAGEWDTERLAQVASNLIDVYKRQLPDFSGYELLQQMADAGDVSFPPVIVYTCLLYTSRCV